MGPLSDDFGNVKKIRNFKMECILDFDPQIGTKVQKYVPLWSFLSFSF